MSKITNYNFNFNFHPKYSISVQRDKNSPQVSLDKELEGCLSTIIDLTVGKKAVIAFHPKYFVYDDIWEIFYTGIVQSLSQSIINNKLIIKIYTNNAIYQLESVKNNF